MRSLRVGTTARTRTGAAIAAALFAVVLAVSCTSEIVQYVLSLTGAGTGSGTLTIAPNGASCSITAGVAADDCSELFDENTLVTLTATPGGRSTFGGWNGACLGTGTCEVMIGGAEAVTATFELITYGLAVAGAGTGTGRVTSALPGISCTIEGGMASSDCTESYVVDSLVTLAAIPDPGSTFDGWSGACTGSGMCQVTMNQARSVTAAFELVIYEFTVLGAGTGNGNVTSATAGIGCTIVAGVGSSDCGEPYAVGSVVELTAAPAAGSTFDGWNGPCTGTGTCQVTITQADTVTATFVLTFHSLTVTGIGAGGGTVSSLPAGINCTISAGATSGDCTELYLLDSIVTLTALPTIGSTFVGWSGPCSGTGACQVVMEQARVVLAAFEIYHDLTVSATSTGDGGVTSDPPGITCTITAGVPDGDCVETYLIGTPVTLTAAPGVGSTFDGWSGACSGAGTCQVAMTLPLNVIASFSASCTLSTPGDTDGDRLPDCAETNTNVYVSQTNTGTDPNNPDTDGDYLDDGDEVLGTLLGLQLPQMGVSALRKDMLVEYDWFDDALDCGGHSHRTTLAALTMVTTAFANAPVQNPDGSTGITFIHDYGQGGVFTGGNMIADANGVLAGGVNNSEFQNYKVANFDANRHGYFHYTILPHRYNTNSSSSGQAELPGDDMIVSLYCAGGDRNVAHTIVHELGHNLNLRHGGFENTNWKPNYNSVMNYKYQFPGADNNCTPPGDAVLNYSLGDRLTLDENNLDETQGVCGNLGPGWDWNGNGNATDVGLTFDINVDGADNGDGILGTLQDSNDWAAVIFSGLASGDGAFLLANEVMSCTNPAPPVQGNDR